MNRRIDDKRFEGAGLVYALLCICCFVLGGAVGLAVGASL